MEEDGAVAPHQDKHRVLGEERARAGGDLRFGVADGGDEKPNGEQESDDLREVAEEGAERGKKPADGDGEDHLRDQEQGQVDQGPREVAADEEESERE